MSARLQSVGSGTTVLLVFFLLPMIYFYFFPEEPWRDILPAFSAKKCTRGSIPGRKS